MNQTSARPVRWAMVGTGFISNTMVAAIEASEGSVLTTVCGRDADRLEQFRSTHGIERASTSLDEVLAAPDVDAVYVGTPNHAHHPVVVAASEAGKAVLSEKSLTRSLPSAQVLADAVTANGTLFVEGLMYLAHPLYRRVLEVLARPGVGELRSISGYYHADINAVANPAGGGTIYNLGCYPVSLVQLIVQTMVGPGAFSNRTVTAAGNRRTTDGHDIVVDAAVTARLGDGVLVTVQSSDTHGMSHGFALTTSTGSLRWHTNPWLPVAGENRLDWYPNDGPVEAIVVNDDNDAFFHQVQVVERALAAGAITVERPSPRLDDSLEIMGFLVEWESAIG